MKSYSKNKQKISKKLNSVVFDQLIPRRIASINKRELFPHCAAIVPVNGSCEKRDYG